MLVTLFQSKVVGYSSLLEALFKKKEISGLEHFDK